MHLKKIDELTEEHFKMIEEMGGTGFPPSEIAEVLQVDTGLFSDVFQQADSEIFKRYRKGYLLAQLKLRQRIFKDAGHGSSPAQTLAKKIMDDCEYKLKTNE